MSQHDLNRRANHSAMEKSIREDDGNWLSGILSLLWFSAIYLPFIILAVEVGRFVSEKLAWHWFVCAILGLGAGIGGYLALVAMEGFSDVLKEEKCLWYIPLKLIVLIFAAGIPFLLGYEIGTSIIGDAASLTEKIIAGSFGGLILGIPAYRNVALISKE